MPDTSEKIYFPPGETQETHGSKSSFERNLMGSCVKVHVEKVQFVIYSGFSLIGKYESVIISCSQSPIVFVGRQLLTEYPVIKPSYSSLLFYKQCQSCSLLCSFKSFLIILIFINLFGFCFLLLPTTILFIINHFVYH